MVVFNKKKFGIFGGTTDKKICMNYVSICQKIFAEIVSGDDFHVGWYCMPGQQAPVDLFL